MVSSDLLAEKHIVPIEASGKPPLYERADLAHHHHFHCERCDAVTPLKGCSLSAKYRLPKGYVASSHEILFSGTCPSCH